MKPDDISTELWSLANIITGFSIAQSIAVAIALGKDLAGLQRQTSVVKWAVALVTVCFAGLYCFAVHKCWTLARLSDSGVEAVWKQVTYGREIAICVFTLVFIFGLFAPELFQINVSPQRIDPQNGLAPSGTGSPPDSQMEILSAPPTTGANRPPE
jgi:hypothetical protein